MFGFDLQFFVFVSFYLSQTIITLSDCRRPRWSGYWRLPDSCDWSGLRGRSIGTQNTALLFCYCWWLRSRWSHIGWRAYGTRSATRNVVMWTAKLDGWTYWPTTPISSTHTTTLVVRVYVWVSRSRISIVLEMELVGFNQILYYVVYNFYFIQ